MALTEIRRELESRVRCLTLFDPPPGLADAFAEHFCDRAVIVRVAESSPGTGGFAVLTGRDTDPLAIVDVSTLQPPYETGETAATAAQLSSRIVRDAFVSDDPAQLDRTTREIEDRAWRSGQGTLHLGVGPWSTPTRAEVVSRLAGSGLDVHVYLRLDRPDAPVDRSAFGEAVVHRSGARELDRLEFVAFDGGPSPTDRCALLIDRDCRSEGRTGVWTYDGGTVDAILHHLEEQY
jgi:hypothetical protein